MDHRRVASGKIINIITANTSTMYCDLNIALMRRFYDVQCVLVGYDTLHKQDTEQSATLI